MKKILLGLFVMSLIFSGCVTGPRLAVDSSPYQTHYKIISPNGDYIRFGDSQRILFQSKTGLIKKLNIRWK